MAKDPLFMCAYCGNPLRPGSTFCVLCEHEQPVDEQAPLPNWLYVDMHDDLPSWEQRRLDRALNRLVMGEARSLLLFHGYGKSGRGGTIKKRVRARLLEWGGDSMSKAWYGGEELASEGQWQQLPLRLQRSANLRKQLQRNPGMTLVLD